MQYCSTRGAVRGRDFREVLFSGFAPDGGMFMPETLPVLSPETLRCWRGLTYPRLVLEVSSLFIPAPLIPRDQLEGEKFCYQNPSATRTRLLPEPVWYQNLSGTRTRLVPEPVLHDRYIHTD